MRTRVHPKVDLRLGAGAWRHINSTAASLSLVVSRPRKLTFMRVRTSSCFSGRRSRRRALLLCRGLNSCRRRGIVPVEEFAPKLRTLLAWQCRHCFVLAKQAGGKNKRKGTCLPEPSAVVRSRFLCHQMPAWKIAVAFRRIIDHGCSQMTKINACATSRLRKAWNLRRVFAWIRVLLKAKLCASSRHDEWKESDGDLWVHWDGLSGKLCMFSFSVSWPFVEICLPDCDEFGVWPVVANDLSSRLPLKNLRWQPSSQRSERFISSLEVDLQRFSFEQVPQPLLSAHTTYLNLYFVSCDVRTRTKFLACCSH